MNENNMKDFFKSLLKTGLPFGIGMTFVFSLRFSSLLTGLFAGMLSGLFFGAAMSIFLLKQKNKMEAKGNIFEGKNLIHQGPANHFVKMESRGGWLYLTESGLTFLSHGVNIVNKRLDISLDQISKVEIGLTFGLVPNQLRVTLKNGVMEKFVVTGRKTWAEVIRKKLV